jgi:hypothetical protein
LLNDKDKTDMWNPFKKRKNYASPYYGENGPLFGNGAAMPLRQDTEDTGRKPVLDISQVRVPYTKPNELDWEQRRYEVARILVAQDRRSVVLGKLKASHRQIAANARALADALINELQTHPCKRENEDGGETDDV